MNSLTKWQEWKTYLKSTLNKDKCSLDKKMFKKKTIPYEYENNND